MALSSVYYLQTSRSPGRKELSIRTYRAAQLSNIVPKHLAKAAGLKKISLHVDDEERTMRGLEFELVRFRVNAQDPSHLRD